MRKTGLIVAAVAGWAIASSVVFAASQEGEAAVPVSEQSGKITFNGQTGAVGAHPDRYSVPYEHELELTLDLEVVGGGEAAFADPPVRFPHGDPPRFRWRKVSPTRVILFELNTNRKPGTNQEYYFKARIASGGEIHESPDPSIVNVGPPAS